MLIPSPGTLSYSAGIALQSVIYGMSRASWPLLQCPIRTAHPFEQVTRGIRMERAAQKRTHALQAQGISTHLQRIHRAAVDPYEEATPRWVKKAVEDTKYAYAKKLEEKTRENERMREETRRENERMREETRRENERMREETRRENERMREETRRENERAQKEMWSGVARAMLRDGFLPEKIIPYIRIPEEEAKALVEEIVKEEAQKRAESASAQLSPSQP